jgi:hypothetical protein
MTIHRARIATKLLLASIVAVAAFEASNAAAQETSSELTVTEVLLASSLTDGQAATPTTTFTHADGRIYAVVRLTNPSREATNIVVTFESLDGGTAHGSITLPIPATRRYRTVARVTTSRPPGRYACVVRTEDGRELSRVELTIAE